MKRNWSLIRRIVEQVAVAGKFSLHMSDFPGFDKSVVLGHAELAKEDGLISISGITKEGADFLAASAESGQAGRDDGLNRNLDSPVLQPL